MSILALTWMQGPIIAYTLDGPTRDPNMNMGGGGGGLAILNINMGTAKSLAILSSMCKPVDKTTCS